MQKIIKEENIKDYKNTSYLLEIRTAGKSFEVVLSSEDAAPELYRTLQRRKYTTLAAAKKAFNNVLRQF